MNKDGAGYAFTADGNVRIRRAVDWKDIEKQFEADFATYGKASHFLVHFRIKTHGLVDKANCHPFRMADGGALIHNGIIAIPNIPESKSDTRWFVERIVNSLPKNWQYSQEWTTMMMHMIGGASKVVCLWPDNDFLIFGESRGQWEDEHGNNVYTKKDEEPDESRQQVWYSNNSCRLPTEWELRRRRGEPEPSYYSSPPIDWRNPNPKAGDRYPVIRQPGFEPLMKDSDSSSTGSGQYRNPLADNPNWEMNANGIYERKVVAPLHTFRSEEEKGLEEKARIAALDNDEWNVECIDKLHMCPKCADQFPNRGLAYHHWLGCTREGVV